MPRADGGCSLLRGTHPCRLISITNGCKSLAYRADVLPVCLGSDSHTWQFGYLKETISADHANHIGIIWNAQPVFHHLVDLILSIPDSREQEKAIEALLNCADERGSARGLRVSRIDTAQYRQGNG